MELTGDPFNMARWGAHDQPDTWPVRAGHRFIIPAFLDILETMFGLDGGDLLCEPIYSAGYRNAVASHFKYAMMLGSLSTWGQSTSGSDLVHIQPTEWTPERAEEALATGTVCRHARRSAIRHWVFVPEGEMTLMRLVLSQSDMLYPEAEEGPVEKLGNIVLDNLSRLADSGRDRAFTTQANEVIKLFLPTMRMGIEPGDDLDRFQEAVVKWLRGLFDADRHGARTKASFAAEASASFGPYMSERLFERVWAEAVSMKPHDLRARRGRRKHIQ